MSETPLLAVTRPQIYFGEAENNYVFVGTGTQEFDYPAGDHDEMVHSVTLTLNEPSTANPLDDAAPAPGSLLGSLVIVARHRCPRLARFATARNCARGPRGHTSQDPGAPTTRTRPRRVDR